MDVKLYDTLEKHLLSCQGHVKVFYKYLEEWTLIVFLWMELFPSRSWLVWNVDDSHVTWTWHCWVVFSKERTFSFECLGLKGEWFIVLFMFQEERKWLLSRHSGKGVDYLVSLTREVPFCMSVFLWSGQTNRFCDTHLEHKYSLSCPDCCLFQETLSFAVIWTHLCVFCANKLFLCSEDALLHGGAGGNICRVCKQIYNT